jgi:hypothetical protein
MQHEHEHASECKLLNLNMQMQMKTRPNNPYNVQISNCELRALPAFPEQHIQRQLVGCC